MKPSFGGYKKKFVHSSSRDVRDKFFPRRANHAILKIRPAFDEPSRKPLGRRSEFNDPANITGKKIYRNGEPQRENCICAPFRYDIALMRRSEWIGTSPIASRMENSIRDGPPTGAQIEVALRERKTGKKSGERDNEAISRSLSLA